MKYLTMVLAACTAAVMPISASAAIMVDTIWTTPWTSTGWRDFGVAASRQPGGVTTGALADATALTGASALIVKSRTTVATLSATEVQNLKDFISSGRRVLLVGEHGQFKSWNDSIVAVASEGTGSTMFGVYSASKTAVRVRNELTAGMTTLAVPSAGLAVGGTSLFGQNVATLWGSGNVLTVLDSNVFDDGRNTRFTQNVAAWLGASPTPAVPEPSTWAMMILGFGAIGHLLRRRPVRDRHDHYNATRQCLRSSRAAPLSCQEQTRSPFEIIPSFIGLSRVQHAPKKGHATSSMISRSAM